MRVWAALCCVAVAVGVTVGCGVSIGGDTYREETLLSDVFFASGLAVDYTTNLLYFGYRRRGLWFSANLDLRNKTLNEIEELYGQCTFAVDQVQQQVHAGCRGDEDGRGRGLFQFDSNVDRFVPAGEAGQRVEFVYYNDGLYYSVRPSCLLHTFRKGHGARVQDLESQVWGMVIDKQKNWIFYNWTAVYRRRPGAAGASSYAGLDWPQAVTVDARGAAYVCDYNYPDGAIFLLPDRSPSATKLLDVGCSSLTFDRDNNMIYGEHGGDIVRLVKC